jgi:WhiB family redox-sensing transcriptional regulator
MTKQNPQLVNLRPVYDEWAWQEDGKCKEADTEIFFLDSGESGKQKREKQRKAKAICKGCPVVNECLQHAMKTPEYFGVWGGMTADERLKILEKRLS